MAAGRWSKILCRGAVAAGDIIYRQQGKSTKNVFVAEIN